MMEKNTNIKLLQVIVLYSFVSLTTILHGNNFSIEKDVNSIAMGHADPNGIVFYVSPGGNDDGMGREKQPFLTISRAVQAVRDWRSSGGTGPASIVLRQGRYQLDKTLVLGIGDGAPGKGKTENKNEPGAGSSFDPAYLSFTAYPGEKPVISSGVPVTGWKLVQQLPEGMPLIANGKVWVADIPDGINKFYTLYDSGGRLNRARTKGFNPTKMGTQETLYFPPGSLKNWSNLNDVEIFIRPLNPWTVNMLPLAFVDEKAGIARTAVTATYEMSPLKNGTHNRFGVSVWVENVPEALDEPGEWVLNTITGKIYLWPRETQSDGSPSEIFAPALCELIRVEGQSDYDGSYDKPVRGIAFKGLSFTHGDRYAWTNDEDRLGWGLQHDWEMFDRPTALLRFRGAEECLVTECRFEQSGGTGLRLDLHARHNRITGNEFSHLGEAGILLAGYGPGTKDVNRNNDIINNHIHHFGEIIWHAGGIWAWQSGYNRIAHNYLHHCPYSAILATCRIKPEFQPDDQGGRTIRHDEISPMAVNAGKTYEGWIARKKYHHSRHNVIEFNEISHSVQKLSDGNGIYISGAGTANIVRYNYLHHNDAPTVTETIRCDDDQHNTLIYGNIIEHSVGLSVLSSKGMNYFVNNYILHSKDTFNRAYISFERYNVSGAVVRQNIIAGNKGGTICKYTKIGEDSFSMLKTIEMDHNLYYHFNDPSWAEEYLEKTRAFGQEKESIFANPLFMDYTGGNYLFQEASPALGLGIEALDQSCMGRLKQANPGTESNSTKAIGLSYSENILAAELPQGKKEGVLSIYTLSGRKVDEVRLPAEQVSFYTLKNLPQGWYLAQLEYYGQEARTQFYHDKGN